ncbi:MAG: Ig-like domain-containing protein, partial [Pseudohongiellaceae bacterium]
DMVVSVAVSQITGLLHGSHIVAADSRTHSLGFAAGVSAATLSIAIINDNQEEYGSSIIATVRDGGAYDLGVPASASVSVLDDDGGEGTPPEGLGLIASIGGRQILESVALAEGQIARLPIFVITTDPIPETAFPPFVDVSVTLGGATRFLPAGAATAYTVRLVEDYPILGIAGPDLVIDLDDDGVAEADGVLTFTVSAPGMTHTFNLGDAGADALLQIGFTDDDRLTGFGISAGVDVMEGDADGDVVYAVFTLVADRAARAPGEAVSVLLEQSGNYVAAAGLGARTVTIATGQASASFSLAIVNDEVVEADGFVTATVQDLAGYDVNTAASAATVNVADDDTAAPTVALPLADSFVNAAGASALTVAGSAVANATISIGVTSSGGGTFNSGRGGVPVATGADADGDWSTEVDLDGLMDGTLTISVTAVDVDAGKSESAATRRQVILDTTAPEVTITALSNSVQVNLGTEITFAFDEAPPSFGASNYSITSGGTLGTLSGSGTSYTATFTAGAVPATTVTISVAAGFLTDAAGNESDAARLEISVAELPTSAPPVVSVPTEDGAFVNIANVDAFRVSGSAAAGADVSIGVADGVNADVIASTSADTGGDWMADLDLGSLNEVELTITVTASESGKAATRAAAIGVAKDTVAPTVDIAAAAISLRSGAITPVTFAFSDVPPSFTLTDVAGGDGGSLSGLTGGGLVRSASFTAGSTNATVTVSVADALFADAAGNDNTGGSLAITVFAPVISIAASASSVAEANNVNAVFVLTADVAPLANLGVAVTVVQDGAYVLPANLGDRTVTIMAGDTSATLNVAIDNDDRDEVDGSVTATLAG